MIPRPEFNKVGVTPGFENADSVDFSQVFVASETDTAATINSKIEEGLHIILQPGNYNLEDSINVTKANTVVMGIGLATLVSANGKPCINVSTVDGVRVSGLLLQAGPVESETLILWGSKGYAGDSKNPGVIQDVYARVGGMNPTGDVKTGNMM